MVARKYPAWESALLRKHPRMGFVAPVEFLYDGTVLVGKSRNLSLGGMLLETPCTLPLHAKIFLHFQLGTGVPVIAAARIVHSRPGVRVGLEFTRMDNLTRAALAQALQIKASFERRSIRIPERLMVRLLWDEAGRFVDQCAQTILLSRHGCLLAAQAAPAPASRLVIFCPDRRIGVPARVVSREQDEDGLFTVALEFISNVNLWGIDFEPEDWQRCRAAASATESGGPIP